MANRISIRTDCSSKIGLGHIMRCFALAQMLKNNFKITFYCKEVSNEIKKTLQETGFDLELLSAEDEFFNKLNSNDIVVLDGYAFNTEYQNKIKKKGCKLICIDDLHDKEFFADLIINHAPGVKPNDYKAQPYTQFALGLEYALLRPAFLEQAKKNRVLKKIETVLICFGGSDNKNLTEITLKIVLTFKEFKKIIVVTGSSYNYSNTLIELLKTDKRIVHYHSVTENQMSVLLAEADLAIVPASGVLFEALSAGCKIISGMYVENQKILFEQFKLLKAFESAENFNTADLKTAITNSLINSSIHTKLIDGKSGKRNLSVFMQLMTNIREANESDCKLLFEWANNKEVRQNAVSKEPILWENHLKWFNSKINSTDCKIFILEYNNIPAGQIRYDKKANFCTIDYSVDSKYRGLGFGKILVQKTLPLFKKNKIKAIVKKENTSSENIFTSLKFNKNTSETINNEVYFIFELQP